MNKEGFSQVGLLDPFLPYVYLTSEYHCCFDINLKHSFRDKLNLFLGHIDEKELISNKGEKYFGQLRYGLPFIVHFALAKKEMADGRKYYLVEIQSDSVQYLRFKKGQKVELSEEMLNGLFEDNEKMVLKIGKGLGAQPVDCIKDGRDLESSDKEPFFQELYEGLGNRFKGEIDGLSLVYGKNSLCTAFLLRKILEKQLILTFLRAGLDEKIQSGSKKGNYLSLNNMLDLATKQKDGKGYPMLLMNTRQKLGSVRFLGNTAAHNILVDEISFELIGESLSYIDIALRELINFKNNN